MKKVKFSKKSQRILVFLGAFITVAGISIPSATSCSHVYNDQLLYDDTTSFSSANPQISINKKIDPNWSDKQIIDDFWKQENLNVYKQKIVDAGIYVNTKQLTAREISIPYSSIMVKRGVNPSFIKVFVSSYTRVFNYNGIPMNLSFTTFPQHSSYTGFEYKINAETYNEFIEISTATNDEVWKKYISDQQRKSTRLFASIPGINYLSTEDIEIISAGMDPNSKKTIFDIKFYLKCLYSQTGSNQQEFTLHISNSGVSQYSSEKNSYLRTTPDYYAAQIRQDNQRFINNQIQKVEEHECMTQIVFNFE